MAASPRPWGAANWRGWSSKSGTAHKLTGQTQGILQNAFTYNSTTGLLSTVRWGNSNSPSTSTLASTWSQGLSTLVLGAIKASWTDPNGNVTVYTLDSKGRVLLDHEPNGAEYEYTRDAAGRVTVMEDPLGYVTTYTRDAAGFVTQVALPDGNFTTMTYQVNFHAMTSMTDERGDTTTYGYDASGHLTTITNALSEVTTNVYNGTTGLLTSITDGEGHTTTFTYDTARRLQTTTDVYGGLSSLTYDATSGEVATAVDALVRTTSYVRDTMGRVTSIVYADGNYESFVYNNAGMLDYHLNKEGVKDMPTYDPYARGLVMTQSQAGGTAVQRNTGQTFDNAGRTITSRNARGYSTTMTLDSVGNETGETNALGNGSREVYDLDNRLIASRDEMGNWTTYTYNTRGWLTSTTDSAGNVWTTAYDAVGNVTSSTDPLNHTTATSYDALNRVSTTTDQLSRVTTTTYWKDGRVKDVIDPLGHDTRYDIDFVNKKYTTTELYGTGSALTTEENFDLAGQTTSTKDGLGKFTSYTYNSVGDMVKVEDPLNHSTTYTVDKNGVTTKVTDAMSKALTITHDALERETATKDASGVSTSSVLDAEDELAAEMDGLGHLDERNVYDALGEETMTVDALGGITRMRYDADGRMIAYIDSLGNITSYEYNSLGELTKVTDPNSHTITFAYDAAGRQTGQTDQLGRVKEFTYLNNGLLSTEVWKSGGAPVNTLTYTYNSDDQMLTAGDANGNITFTYNGNDQVTQVDDSKGGTRAYTYNDGGLAVTMTYSDSGSQLREDFSYNADNSVTDIKRYTDTAGTTLESETVYGYDDAQKVTSITHKNAGGTTVDSFNYTYDAAGKITLETSTLGPTNTYTYDLTDQVTGDGTETFAWDANGNPTGGGNTVTTGNRLTSDGTWTYTQDDAGNVTEKGKSGEYWFYSYDTNNRLTHIEKRTTEGGSSVLSIDFKYNVFGDRIERDYDADGAGAGAAVALKMAYENGNAFLDMDSGLTVSTRRVYSGGLDSLVARINSGSAEDWYLTDNIGSVRDIVNGSGTLLDHIDYSTFGGSPTETHSADGDRYKFSGREWEAEAQIQYNRARYLQNGRWMSQDPLGFDAGDSNLYRYVRNTAVNAIDPTGHSIWSFLRAPVPLGKWIDVGENRWGKMKLQYVSLKNAQNKGDSYKVVTDISFVPNKLKADSSQIAFVQIFKILDRNMKPIQGIRDYEKVLKRRTADGWAVDRKDGFHLGWYGFDKTGEPTSTGRAQGGYYATGGTKTVPPIMADGQSWNQGDTHWYFETYAISKRGSQEGRIYGGISWGFDVNKDGKITLREPILYRPLVDRFGMRWDYGTCKPKVPSSSEMQRTKTF